MQLTNSKNDNPEQTIFQAFRYSRIFLHSLQGKSHLCIPFLGKARLQYQFQHSCVCMRYIYIPRIGPHISLQQNRLDPVIFVCDLQDAYYFFLKLHLHYFTKIKSHKEFTKLKELRFFIKFLLDYGRIRNGIRN
jgi:hypothetical protein